jgi:hypothetical protein
MYIVAAANSAVSPSPNSANEMMMRLRSRRRYGSPAMRRRRLR